MYVKITMLLLVEDVDTPLIVPSPLSFLHQPLALCHHSFVIAV